MSKELEKCDLCVINTCKDGCVKNRISEPTLTIRECRKFVDDWLWDSKSFGDKRVSEYFSGQKVNDCAQMIRRFATDFAKSQTEWVSEESSKIILNCLNNSLKYGKKLLVDCDDEDEQGQIDVWRTNQEIEKAIKEIEQPPTK